MSSKRKKNSPLPGPSSMKRARSAQAPAAAEDVDGLKHELEVLKYKEKRIGHRLVLEKQKVQEAVEEAKTHKSVSAKLRSRATVLATAWKQVLSDMESILSQAPDNGTENTFLKQILQTGGQKDDDAEVSALLTRQKDFTLNLLKKCIKIPVSSDSERKMQQLVAEERKAGHELVKAKTELEATKAALDQTKKEVAAMKLDHEISAKKAIRLEKSIEELKIANTELKLKNDSALVQVKVEGGVKGEQNNGKATADQTSGAVVDAKFAETYKKKNNELREQIVGLKKKIWDLEVQVKTPKDENVKSTQVYRGLENQLFVVQQDNKHVKDTLERMTKHNETLGHQLITEKQRYSELKSHLETKLESRVSEVVAMRIQRERMQAKNQEAKLEKVESELKATKEEMEKLQAQAKSTKDKMDKLQVDSETLKQLTEDKISWRLLIRGLDKKRRDLASKLSAFENLDNEKQSLAEVKAREETLRNEHKKLQEHLDKIKDGNLATELDTQKMLMEELEGELNDLGTSYGEIEAENSNLKDCLKEAEKMKSKILGERAKLEEKLEIARKEKLLVEKKCDHLANLLKERENHHHKFQEHIEKQKKAAMDREAAMNVMATQVEAYRRQTLQATQEAQKKLNAEQDKASPIEELKKQLETSEKARQKLDSDKTHLITRLDKYKKRLESNKEAGGADEDLQFMLDESKRKIICTLCDTNEKNCIIVRCMHAFCRQCIDKNLKVRNRNCPQCQQAFGKHDVKEFWL